MTPSHRNNKFIIPHDLEKDEQPNNSHQQEIKKEREDFNISSCEDENVQIR